ncbi:MAG: hydroxyacid dehydrogenase [Betaproteobacteria bacterium]|nr:hydroxyacid dehydrogenase [Betaproteobacteria bacterium]
MRAFTVLVTSPRLAQEAQQILQAAGGDLIYMDDPVTEEALIAKFSDASIAAVMMRGSPPFTSRVVRAARDLRIIAKVGAGFENVDMDEATARGIAVMTSGAASADAVAEHTLALMLSLVRELPRLDRNIRLGQWEQRHFKGREFSALTVGIVGYGRIGRKVAQLVAAFGARVLVHSRSARSDSVAAGGIMLEPDLDRLLRSVDILSLHGRLTDSTRGMIGRRELALMKPTAYLINTARGAIVDEAALVDALKGGRLAGAGLDAFAVEPTTSDNPLFALPNVLCTSHVASAAQETVIRVATLAAENVVACLQGRDYDHGTLANPEALARARVNACD